MPEREFELYLSLLSRFLRLRPDQRAEIADELRDHLEERLDELTREGLSREEAVVRALEEFGDAASLASHFTRITRQRKRRLIMRLTLCSTVAVTLAVLIGLAIWPAGPVNAPQQANAQQNAPPQREAVDKADASPDAPAPRDKREAAVQEKLSKRLSKVEFENIPLTDVLKTIGDEIGVDILFNRRALDDLGVLPSEIRASLVLKHTDISAKTALELLLEGEDLAYRIRDGFIYVETIDSVADVMEIQVYNVRDLLANAEATVQPRPAGTGGGLFSVPAAMDDGPQARHSIQLAQFDMGGQGGFGGGMGEMGMGPVDRIVKTPTQALIEVIQMTTSGPWFAEQGEGGTISAFDGLLVVRQTQAMHREVEQLLDMMRAAMKEQPRAKKPAKRSRPDGRKGRGADADADDVSEGLEKFESRRTQPRETDESPESLLPGRP